MADLKIVISAENNTTTDFDTLKTDIEEVGTAGETAGEGVDTFDDSLLSLVGIASGVAAAIGIVIDAMERVYQQAIKGADDKQVISMFENLTESAGILANEALPAMQKAAGDSVPKIELMRGASMALSVGLATNTDDLTRIAGVSADLDLPMTKVVDLLTNVSETSFEKLGINMDGFKGQVDTLIESGEGWTESTAESEIALQRMEAQVVKTGSALDTESAVIKRQEAAVADLTDAKEQDALTTVSKYMPAITDSVRAQELAITGTKLQYASLQDLFAAQDMGQVSTDQFASSLLELNALQAAGVSVTAAGAVETSAYMAALSNAGLTIDATTGKIRELNAQELADKELKMTVDDSEVQNYEPPDKYGVVHYAENVGRGRAVGGPVNSGEQYNWQEYGYRGEVFVPSADGFVLSRADAERALAKALYGGGSAVDPEAIGRAVAQAMSSVTAKGKGGNVYNLTMPTSSNPADVRTAFELMEAWA